MTAEASPEEGGVQVGYAVIDDAFRLQEASSYFCRLLGNPPPGARLDDLLPVFAGMETALAALGSGELPYLHLHAVAVGSAATERLGYLEVTVLPHLGRAGLFLAVRDSTAQVEMERAIIQRRNELRLLSQSLPRSVPALAEATAYMDAIDRDHTLLLAWVVHNVQTPLVAVIAYAEWLLHDAGGALTPAQQAALGSIINNSARAALLSSHLHSWPLLDSSPGPSRAAFSDVVIQPDLTMQAVDLTAQAQAAIQLCAGAASACDVRLEVQSQPAPLVFGASALLIEAFAGLVGYLLAKAASGQRIVISIQPSADRHSDPKWTEERPGVLALIQASGWRLRAEERELVFSPFHGAPIANSAIGPDPRWTPFNRPDMGPFLARVIADVHDGRVWISDGATAHGEGTTDSTAFAFWLPSQRSIPAYP